MPLTRNAVMLRLMGNVGGGGRWCGRSQELARISTKKAEWYTSRDLATVVSEPGAQQLRIKLRFKPAGATRPPYATTLPGHTPRLDPCQRARTPTHQRCHAGPLHGCASGQGHGGDTFHLADHSNVCVCCGATAGLRRYFIVPKKFRSHFPLNAKCVRTCGGVLSRCCCGGVRVGTGVSDPGRALGCVAQRWLSCVTPAHVPRANPQVAHVTRRGASMPHVPRNGRADAVGVHQACHARVQCCTATDCDGRRGQVPRAQGKATGTLECVAPTR